MVVNADRLWERFHKLADFGSVPGQPQAGITRYAYSKEYRMAADLLIEYMEALGLEVWTDPAGNIFGKLQGVRQDTPCLMLGSHLDTVTTGGRFDGLAGVAAALEVVSCMVDGGVTPQHPVVIAALANEEGCQFKGGVMGSKAMAGQLPLDHPTRVYDNEGNCLADAMADFGARPDCLADAVWRKGDILAFLELHIEQAAKLEREGYSVGIVTKISGIRQMLINIDGQAAHAGGVAMEDRHDAVAAAVKIATEVERLAKACSPETRGTVGYLKSWPGEHNIIAARAQVPVDFREADTALRTKLFADFTQRISEICQENRVRYDVHMTMDMHDVSADSKIMELYRGVAEKNGIPCMDIISYAAHDSMILADICPVGMLFLRSKDGLSHCPEEWTEKEDYLDGTTILLHTAMQIAENGLGQ